jgi:hypothetical protein
MVFISTEPYVEFPDAHHQEEYSHQDQNECVFPEICDVKAFKHNLFDDDNEPFAWHQVTQVL